MKNKKAFLINLILATVWVGLLVLFNLCAINFLNAKVGVAILCSVVGVVVHYFIALIFHELGHLIFAKKNKLVINRINFGLFSIDYTKQPKSVKFFTLRSSFE